MSLLDDIQFNKDGLVPAIAQEQDSGRVLMLAWMNAEAVTETLRTGHAVYFSRSRQRLWRKGETSGNEQVVKNIQLDCDGDTILLHVEQRGGIACHTGRESCFYLQPNPNDHDRWHSVEPVLKSPEDMYGKQ